MSSTPPPTPRDPDDDLTELEVIANLWFAHDMIGFARVIGAGVAVASIVALVLASRSDQTPTTPGSDWSPGLIVVLASIAGVGGIYLFAYARRRPDLAVPICLGALSIVLTLGTRDALTIALGATVAACTWWLWRARIQQAQRLAARHPQLQAAKALRGEPYRRDPHAP